MPIQIILHKKGEKSSKADWWIFTRSLKATFQGEVYNLASEWFGDRSPVEQQAHQNYLQSVNINKF